MLIVTPGREIRYQAAKTLREGAFAELPWRRRDAAGRLVDVLEVVGQHPRKHYEVQHLVDARTRQPVSKVLEATFLITTFYKHESFLGPACAASAGDDEAGPSNRQQQKLAGASTCCVVQPVMWHHRG